MTIKPSSELILFEAKNSQEDFLLEISYTIKILLSQPINGIWNNSIQQVCAEVLFWITGKSKQFIYCLILDEFSAFNWIYLPASNLIFLL